MRRAVKQYAAFLGIVASLFAAAAAKSRGRCTRGCRVCCTGFFGISPLDALYLRQGLGRVPAPVRKRILAKANEQLAMLETEGLLSRNAPFLSSAAVDLIARRSAKLLCPALDRNNRCMLYECRPLLCRTFGPAVRGQRRAVLAGGCGHFMKDFSGEDFPILSIWKDEDVLLKTLFAAAGSALKRRRETIIPAAIALDMEKYLKK